MRWQERKVENKQYSLWLKARFHRANRLITLFVDKCIKCTIRPMK
jgi:hypothetical protein